ncbi:MAG: hydantoinase/oxoprolinase family protein [Acidimicrobiales bacterium]
MLDALDQLAGRLGSTVGELERCSLFVHGSTVATNTLLEGKGATVGLLTTAGFRDALETGSGHSGGPVGTTGRPTPVLVPATCACPCGAARRRRGGDRTARHGRGGRRAGDVPVGRRQSIAVALFNSFVDDGHEQAVRAELERLGAGPWVTTSAAVAPIMGEYERTSTAVVNAALAPRIVDYLRALDEQLRARGLSRAVLLVQSNGGVASVPQLAPRPVNLLLSGPAAGVGALNLYRSWAGTDDVISMEIGGTSCDVLLMADGQVDTKDELFIGGYHVATPSIDIHTIGAGGGTIARVDDAGLLVVGPDGAGADPGPACYGRGGTDPTVTDAQLVLGRLRPGPYADGVLTLDAEAARAAIAERVAGPLGIDVETAAAGIVALVEQHLLHAVEYLSIERGHSPRRFTLVAAGGAGPMHGAAVGRALGCRRVYVPRQAGAFCALGMLHADIRQDFQRFLLAEVATVDAARVLDAFAELEAQALDALQREGVEPERCELTRSIDLRYAGQLWSIRVTVGTGGFDADAVRAAFESEYVRLYGHLQPNGTLLMSSVRVTGRASTGPLAPVAPPGGDGAPLPVETRKVFHGSSGWLDTAVYAGRDLSPGARVAGPAIVEEATTTVVLGPADELAVDRGGTSCSSCSSRSSRTRRAPWLRYRTVWRAAVGTRSRWPCCSTAWTRSPATWAG